jgi:Flp pilus assembly protein TadB
MAALRDSDTGEGVFALVKEMVDGLGDLTAGHLKLARVEIAADVREYGRRMKMLVIGAAFLLLGYALACVALALALARLIGAPLSFLSIAGAHLIGGGIGLVVILRRPARARPLEETMSELDRTVSVLARQVTNGAAPSQPAAQNAALPPTI